VLVLPFFALAPGGVGFSLWSQAKRHLQSETLAASALLVADKLHVYSARFVGGSPGSVDLGGRLPDALSVLSTLVSLILVALVLATYWRGPDTDRRLVTAWAAALVGFTFFGKVLSPQYLTWVIPFVPLAAGRRGLYAAGTLLVAMALTQPYSFLGRIYHYDWTIWVLFVRNMLLVATFAFLYSALRAEPS
jgi:hypothetical protein